MEGGDIGITGLPGEKTLYDMAMRYCARRGLNNSAEAYPWQANAHYWMVTSLYKQMKSENLTEAELRRTCRKELEKMSRRIRERESITPPCAQLEKIYVPVSPERAKVHIDGIKKLLKRNSRNGQRLVIAPESNSVE